MGKHFVIGEKRATDKSIIQDIEKEKESFYRKADSVLKDKSKSKLQEEDFLLHTENRVVVKVDMKGKNSWRFSDGTTIHLEREFNNFNRRYTQPVNAIVISGEGIPKNAEILVDHNAFHETNRINDYKNSFESEESDRIRYFSLERYECYAWRTTNSEWTPLYPYEFAIRVFKPYTGVLENIEPEQLKDTLFVLSGNLKGSVVKTVKGADYCIIYKNDKGTESYLIVFRPNGEEKRKLEEEAICILHELTDKVNTGEYLIGYEIKDAKPLNKNVSIP